MSAAFVSCTPLEISEVACLLKNLPQEGICTLPPVKPKGGEVYVYRSDKKAEKAEG